MSPRDGSGARKTPVADLVTLQAAGADAEHNMRLLLSQLRDDLRTAEVSACDLEETLRLEPVDMFRARSEASWLREFITKMVGRMPS